MVAVSWLGTRRHASPPSTVDNGEDHDERSEYAGHLGECAGDRRRRERAGAQRGDHGESDPAREDHLGDAAAGPAHGDRRSRGEVSGDLQAVTGPRYSVCSPDGAKRNPGTAVPHCASLHAGYGLSLVEGPSPRPSPRKGGEREKKSKR